MKKFLNRLFGKRMLYTIEMDGRGHESVLRGIKRDRCIKYETLRTKRDGIDKFIMSITTTYRNIKTLIKHLEVKEDLLNIAIYENDDDIDLVTRRRRAWF